MTKKILTAEERWEQDIPHHPKSEALVKAIADIDVKYGNDYFQFKFGGDGDNGEELLYLLDVYFDQIEKGKREAM